MVFTSDSWALDLHVKYLPVTDDVKDMTWILVDPGTQDIEGQKRHICCVHENSGIHFHLVTTATQKNQMSDTRTKNKVSSVKWLGSFGGFLNDKSVCCTGGFWVPVGGRDSMGGQMGSCVRRWWVTMTQDRLYKYNGTNCSWSLFFLVGSGCLQKNENTKEVGPLNVWKGHF